MQHDFSVWLSFHFAHSSADSESYEPSVHGILISSSTPNDSLQSVHNEQIDSFQPLPHSVSCEQSDESIASTNSSTRRTWSNELEQYRKVSTPVSYSVLYCTFV